MLKEEFNEMYPKNADPPTRILKSKYYGTNSPIYIDGSMNCAATYANSPFQTGREVNAVLVERFYNKHNDMSKIVWLEAIKSIAKNEEILVEYGNDFAFNLNDDEHEKDEHQNVITSSKQSSQETGGVELQNIAIVQRNVDLPSEPVLFNLSNFNSGVASEQVAAPITNTNASSEQVAILTTMNQDNANTNVPNEQVATVNTNVSNLSSEQVGTSTTKKLKKTIKVGGVKSAIASQDEQDEDEDEDDSF